MPCCNSERCSHYLPSTSTGAGRVGRPGTPAGPPLRQPRHGAGTSPHWAMQLQKSHAPLAGSSASSEQDSAASPTPHVVAKQRNAPSKRQPVAGSRRGFATKSPGRNTTGGTSLGGTLWRAEACDPVSATAPRLETCGPSSSELAQPTLSAAPTATGTKRRKNLFIEMSPVKQHIIRERLHSPPRLCGTDDQRTRSLLSATWGRPSPLHCSRSED